MLSVGLDYFDAIYCINLKSRTDRKKSFEKEMKLLGLNSKIHFFEAIENKQNGHLGCLLSHREIIKIAKKNKYQNILVFEDDAELITQNIPYLKEVMQELRGVKWNIFYLGCSFMWEDLPVLIKRRGLYELHGGRSTHAIVYNKSTFDYILAVTKKPIQFIKKYKALDVYLSLYGQEKMKTLIPLFPIFKQKDGFSDIERKNMSLDSFIITNFNKLTKRSLIKNKIILLIRKFAVLVWKGSNKKINIFFLIHNAYQKMPDNKIKKRCKKLFGQKE